MKTHVQMFGVLVLVVLCACDDDSSTQPVARDLAVEASCDRVQACGEIGVGKNYESRDACDVQLSSTWQNLWPPAECDGRIDNAMLDVCLKSISLAECSNALDLLNIFANKCAKAKVCSRPAAG